MCPKERKQDLQEPSTLPASVQYCSQQPRYGNNHTHQWPTMGERIKNVWYVYVYYSVMRKKEVLPFATAKLDLEAITLNEIN